MQELLSVSVGKAGLSEDKNTASYLKQIRRLYAHCID